MALHVDREERIRADVKREPVHDPAAAPPSTRPRSKALASSQGQVRGVNHETGNGSHEADFAEKVMVENGHHKITFVEEWPS